MHFFKLIKVRQFELLGVWATYKILLKTPTTNIETIK